MKTRDIEAAPADLRPLLLSLRNSDAWTLVRRADCNYSVGLRHTLGELAQLSADRLKVAQVVLERLFEPLKKNDLRGNHTVGLTLGELETALASNLSTLALGNLETRARDALLYLHDLRTIVLQGGLTLLRPAMTLSMKSRNRVGKEDYKPLIELYRSQVVHIHVMDRYAKLVLECSERALAFVQDYFTLAEPEFLAKHFKSERGSLERPTSARNYQAIVDALGDPKQKSIVTSRKPALLVLWPSWPGTTTRSPRSRSCSCSRGSTRTGSSATRSRSISS